MGGTKYLKYFETHTEYQTYINSQDKLLPNVSYCENENEVHYNPWTDPKLVCKYNITDTTSATALRTEYEQNMFKSMEIDGVLLDSLVTEYQFDTTGEHTVKYELYDETKVGNNSPIFNQIATLTSASIPNSVTTIGDYAFFGCNGLTSVTIPNSVTTIGNSAFYNCSGLTNVTIGNSVTTIGNSAFYNCSGLTSVTLNSDTLVKNSYSSSSKFKSIFGNQVTEYIIGNNVTGICSYAFMDCTGVTSIIIGNSVTSIGYSAFQGCSGLTSVTIPNSVTSISNYAFEYCTSLTSITIPDSVTTIGNQAFDSCRNLTSITIEAVTPPTLGSSAFYETNTNLVIYVPLASVDTYKAATNWSTYASRIQAIPTT